MAGKPFVSISSVDKGKALIIAVDDGVRTKATDDADCVSSLLGARLPNPGTFSSPPGNFSSSPGARSPNLEPPLQKSSPPLGAWPPMGSLT